MYEDQYLVFNRLKDVCRVSPQTFRTIHDTNQWGVGKVLAFNLLLDVIHHLFLGTFHTGDLSNHLG